MNESESELELLKDKCVFYTQFVIQKLSSSPESIQGLEETYRFIQEAYQTKKIKPLRAFSADIDDQVLRHMPLAIAVEFKNLIKEKLKIDYEDVEKAFARVIDRILKNEKISNNQEYELVVNRIDEIFTDHTRSEELKTLNKLLTAFEDLHKK
jgi:hypothetical protein